MSIARWTGSGAGSPSLAVGGGVWGGGSAAAETLTIRSVSASIRATNQETGLGAPPGSAVANGGAGEMNRRSRRWVAFDASYSDSAHDAVSPGRRVNNATYYELFDTAVNAYLYEATGADVRALPQIGVVAETGCRYFREIGFPEPIEMGLVVDKVGTSSIIYRIGLFQGASDEAAAEGRFVHVYVDNSNGAGTRPVAPMPDVVRAAVVPLLRPEG